ncbi:hypothetical protein DLAC_07492 [Tieghemostelium lacteum]|uniref:Uncharacterized protein n=1 Tax=Tieghemostelium lacteum TaxID=361077 RepID=A0A151ZCP5_TIELA|nr:hypothetical protein DLAC_07492 [Tieghemostelium lacteum]|eukprot:KYQ91710.1 hypothetical protein DLAC_07492 [Tieghemostelium lacteum]
MTNPNSFVGVLYAVGFLAGCSYGSLKMAGLKDNAKSHLINDIKAVVADEKKVSYDQGFEAGKKSLVKTGEQVKFNNVIEEIIAKSKQ